MQVGRIIHGSPLSTSGNVLWHKLQLFTQVWRVCDALNRSWLKCATSVRTKANDLLLSKGAMKSCKSGGGVCYIMFYKSG